MDTAKLSTVANPGTTVEHRLCSQPVSQATSLNSHCATSSLWILRPGLFRHHSRDRGKAKVPLALPSAAYRLGASACYSQKRHPKAAQKVNRVHAMTVIKSSTQPYFIKPHLYSNSSLSSNKYFFFSLWSSDFKLVGTCGYYKRVQNCHVIMLLEQKNKMNT